MNAMSPIDTLYALPSVRRGWPAKNGAIVFEQFDANGRIRAGRINADGTVDYTDFATDKKLPELAGAFEPGSATITDSAGTGNTPDLLVHRFNKRAVVHHGEAVTKYVRPGKAAAIAQASTEIRGVCRPLGIGAAQVTDQTDGSITFSVLPGNTLHELGDRGMAGWETFFELWGGFMEGRAGVGNYSAEQETATLAQWINHAQTYAAHPRIAELKEAAGQVAGELAVRPDATRSLLHRDLHDKQLLWDGSTLSVLDLDTAAYGEGALDLGNLLAHVHLRQLQGVVSEGLSTRLDAMLRDFADTHGVSERRLATYARATAIRLACLYAFRPNSAHWLGAWTDMTLNKNWSES